MLRNCRHKYFLIYVSFYVNCSEELDRCGVCFAKLIKHHVSACLVLHLIFTLRKLLVVTTCLFLTECFFWSYRKSWALLLIVSKPLSITWKYSVIGAVLIFSYSSLLKQLFLWLNTFSSMTRSMSGEDGANSSSKQSNPRKYLEEEYLQTEKKVILLTILALLTDDKHALLIEENRDFSYNRHHQSYLQKDF